MENVVEETDNRDPEGDNVPLGDNRGATHGKIVFKEMIWFYFNVSSLLVLNT